MSAAEVTEINSKPVERLRDLQVDGRQDVSKISPHDIVVEEGLNPRDFTLPENIEHIQKLKASILAMGGVQKALDVRWDNARKKPILIDGECRLRSVLELIAEGHPILAVPVIQKSGKAVETVADRLALALTANENRTLGQVEIGKAYLRFKGFGWTVAKIAERLGKTERFVSDALTLADSPDKVQELVKAGDVSKALAVKALKESNGDGEAATQVLEQAAKEAKADGKKTAKAPKVDKKLSKLQRISNVIDDYDSHDIKELSKQDLINYLADIFDVLDDNPAAAQKAA
jgi:ParB-like chromosome segregation protein Spo0J